MRPMQRSVKVPLIAIMALLIIAGIVWYAVVLEDRNGTLAVSFLDVGQGDAIFIDAPSGRQVLIDGGPGSIVVRELSAVMPWYDRTIDMVIPTHPDLDHIGGLIDVLARYRVAGALESSVKGDTSEWEEFQRALTAEGAPRTLAMRGQIVDLGKGAYLEVLFPDRSVPDVETNAGCIVARLVYGDTSFMFSCDAPQQIENYLVRLDAEDLRSNVLKAGHHGSRTSSGALFIGYVSPEYAVISRGCDNRYGHPHEEVMDLFKRFEIPTFDTCTDGTVTFVSDGQTVMRK